MPVPSVGPYRFVNVASGRACRQSLNCFMGNTSLPKATVCRYFGFTSSKVPNALIMVRAETTQQTVLILCWLRYSTNAVGMEKRFLGIRYVVAPNFKVGYSSFRQASKYKGV